MSFISLPLQFLCLPSFTSFLFISALFSLAAISACAAVHWTGFRMPNWLDGGVCVCVNLCVCAHLASDFVLPFFVWYFDWLPWLVTGFTETSTVSTYSAAANFFVFSSFTTLLCLFWFWFQLYFDYISKSADTVVCRFHKKIFQSSRRVLDLFSVDLTIS